MKIFISQPMNGKSDEEIKRERKEIVDILQQEYGDIEVIDSFFEVAPHDASPLWFLGKSLQLLSAADYAFFAYGWQSARGCRIEFEACREYGVNVLNTVKKKNEVTRK